MDRARDVAQVWNWLPAFRAVAETEHLPTAAKKLRVSAPALSRTVRLLEDSLGKPLFKRTGRRLELNDEGVALLDAVRSAMRQVHDGVDEVLDARFTGALEIAAAGLVCSTALMPALVRLRQGHPGLRPRVSTASPSRVVPDLLQGELDLAVLSVPVKHPQLTTVPLGYASNAVWCGPGHALYGQDAVTLDELTRHDFAAPHADPMGATPEGWPTEIPRRVVMALDRLDVGVEAVASGAVLAVLPDVLARRHPARMHRLSAAALPPTPVLAVHRTTLAGDGPVELLVEALRDALLQCLADPGRGAQEMA